MSDDIREDIGLELAAVFSPVLLPLGFRLADVTADGVRYDGDRVRFEARFTARDGELAVRVMPYETDERFDLLLYLRAIGSPAAATLGDGVAGSATAAVSAARIYAAALPDVVGLLAGDPPELARARSLRWWNTGST